MLFRVGLIGAALALAVVPLSPSTVERLYSNDLYPRLQAAVTGLSNSVPFALLDALLLGIAAWLVWILIDGFRSRHGWLRFLGRATLRIATMAAVLYIAFVLAWGLNYRREPVVHRLAENEDGVSSDAARRLAMMAADQLNEHHAAAHASEAFDRLTIDPSLAAAFAETQRLLNIARPAVPGRPKGTLLDPYYKAAAVSGMTDPFFLETLVVSNLLPFERPFVIAHEWSHLAGINDEGEANLVGWLTSLRASDVARYSAWLFMYSEVLPSLPRPQRAEIAQRLGEGPLADLEAIAERQRRSVRPIVANAGWRVYDRYLKANRVEAGTASYAQVVQLVLKTRFGPDWTPILASPDRARER